MKNKNYNINELVNLIIQTKRLQGDLFNDTAYPYATGVLMSIINAATSYGSDLQTEINDSYRHWTKELHWATENQKKIVAA